jgi:hypothetical protein
MDIKAIAQEFIVQYYTTIMKNRVGLINFYLDSSTMTYGGDTFVGRKQIAEKIESFGFQTIDYKIDDKDVQPGPLPNSMLIFVTGSLIMDGTDQFKFSQVFNICPNGSGGLYCHNDIFRLVI